METDQPHTVVSLKKSSLKMPWLYTRPAVQIMEEEEL